jgi:hypothetical protein
MDGYFWLLSSFFLGISEITREGTAFFSMEEDDNVTREGVMLVAD